MSRWQALRARLDESLFPAAPVARAPGPRWERALLVGSLLVLAVFLQLLRVGLSTALDSIWAEDGLVFLQAALLEGTADAILEPYAEYLVLVPRLIAEAAAGVPLADAAAAISVLSATLVAVGGLAVWHGASGHIRDPWLRGALAVVAVLVPVAGLESVASASYVSWYLLFAVFWLLLWRPPTVPGALLGALLIAVTGLSNPGILLLAPIAALRALAVRDRRDLAIVGAFATAAAIQIPILATHDESAEPLWTADVWTAYLQRALDGAAFGEALGGELWAHLGWPFLIAVLVAALAGLAVGFRRADTPG
ncbi:MAG TPA: hypothetical protein VEQ41_04210, partial [Solirubrobacterales bacterium]|nr:hypothetical protein [Solirubrobacterales bacterium]